MSSYNSLPAFARFVIAWLVAGVTDALFSSALSALAYGSTVEQLWQGVASVVLGPEAFNGGMRTAAIGLVLHFGVAFAWTLLFMAVIMQNYRVIHVLNMRFGYFMVAALYGPIIWIVMSFGVIPQFSGRPPAVTVRWWIQFFGHIPFVALPIVALGFLGSPMRRKPGPGLRERFGSNRNSDGSHIDPDGQVNALLTRTAYEYVAARLGMPDLPTGAYDYVFTVRRHDIDAYIALHNIKPEEFGEKYHWLSLVVIDGKWHVREFMPPEKSEAYNRDTPCKSFEAAQRELLTKLLRNAQTNVPF